MTTAFGGELCFAPSGITKLDSICMSHLRLQQLSNPRLDRRAARSLRNNYPLPILMQTIIYFECSMPHFHPIPYFRTAPTATNHFLRTHSGAINQLRAIHVTRALSRPWITATHLVGTVASRPTYPRFARQSRPKGFDGATTAVNCP